MVGDGRTVEESVKGRRGEEENKGMKSGGGRMRGGQGFFLKGRESEAPYRGPSSLMRSIRSS